MTMDPLFPPDDDATPFLVNRVGLLHKLLAGHTSVLRAVIDDLMRCGPEGQRLVHVIVGDQPQLDPTTDDAPTGESG